MKEYLYLVPTINGRLEKDLDEVRVFDTAKDALAWARSDKQIDKDMDDNELDQIVIYRAEKAHVLKREWYVEDVLDEGKVNTEKRTEKSSRMLTVAQP